MFYINDLIKIKEPFNTAFPNTYKVVEVNEVDSWVKVENEESAFDFRFIEVI